MTRIFMRTRRHGMVLTAGVVLAAATSFAGAWSEPALGEANHASRARYAVTDLGSLGGSFAGGNGLNNRGEVVGISILPGDTALRGFLWRDGRIRDVGTLGGPNAVVGDINQSGQVSGWSNTTAPAPPSIFNQASVFCTEPLVAGDPTLACRAFLLDDGKKIDLGTLGGLNSTVGNKGINDAGHVVGTAETTSLDPTSIYGAPTFHAFLWRRGRMMDLGTTGGAPNSVATAVNNRDQVVAVSGMDSTKPDQVGFMWDDGHKTLLGTLGGHSSTPLQINDRGQVVGNSTLAGDATRHAFLWQRGHMADLGTLPGDTSSEAADITNDGQIVGQSCSSNGCRPFLWSNGKAIDLNQALSPTSGWQLFDAQAINARGQITGGGLINGEAHAYLLTPIH